MHLAGQTPERSYYQWFTGIGKQYFLVCEVCAANRQSGAAMNEFRQICWRCFKELDGEGDWAGIVGRPEVLVRSPSLTMSQQRIPFPLTIPLLAFEPIATQGESVWIALTVEGDVVRINLTTQTVTHLMRLPASQLDMSQQVSLYLSAGGEFAAIVNTKGQYGIVVNLSTGEMTMSLARDTYHIKHSSFPIAFFACEGRLLLVHSTAWNRLDFSDPRTGELLSNRTFAASSETKRPEHYLDYFHAGLNVSPGQEWIADNGWAWSPAGLVSTWNLRRWVQENVWESEDGSSRHRLCQRWYYWDGPLCWVDEQTLAVWGYGEDDEWLIPAVRLFDARTSEEPGWFAGPETGTFMFDEYLLSFSKEHDLSIWDVTTGERVGLFPDFRPTHYHQGAKQFLRLDVQDGTVLVGTLTQQ
jgi:hypothetical protein